MNKSQAAIWTLFKEAFGPEQFEKNKFGVPDLIFLKDYFTNLVKTLDEVLERFE